RCAMRGLGPVSDLQGASFGGGDGRRVLLCQPRLPFADHAPLAHDPAWSTAQHAFHVVPPYRFHLLRRSGQNEDFAPLRLNGKAVGRTGVVAQDSGTCRKITLLPVSLGRLAAERAEEAFDPLPGGFVVD